VASIEGDTENQKKWFQRTLDLSQDNPNMLAQLATQKLGQADLNGAKKLIDQAQALDPQNVMVSMLRANILFTSGDREQAETLYDLLESRTENNELIPFLRGVNYFVVDDYKQAEVYLSLAHKRNLLFDQNIASSSMTFYLGVTYFVQDKYAEALPLFEGLREDPLFYAQAYDLLAKTYYKLGRHDDALKAYSSYLSIHPESKNDPQVQLIYRKYYLLNEHTKKPNELSVLLDLGQAFTDLEAYTDAYSYLVKAQKIDPSNPLVDARLGY